MKALLKWLERWQEPVVWLPVLLAIIVVAFYAIPRADPRSGIDGFGGMWATLLVTFDALVAAFVAWLCTRTYFRELRDDEEEKLAAIAVSEATAPGHTWWRALFALVVVLLDRASWFGIWLVIFIKLQR